MRVLAWYGSFHRRRQCCCSQLVFWAGTMIHAPSYYSGAATAAQLSIDRPLSALLHGACLTNGASPDDCGARQAHMARASARVCARRVAIAILAAGCRPPGSACTRATPLGMRAAQPRGVVCVRRRQDPLPASSSLFTTRSPTSTRLHALGVLTHARCARPALRAATLAALAMRVARTFAVIEDMLAALSLTCKALRVHCERARRRLVCAHRLRSLRASAWTPRGI